MLKRILIYVTKLLREIKEDDIFAISAQFSYYIILSIFPFIILLMSLFSHYTSYLFYLLNSVAAFIPYDVYNIILNIVSGSSSMPNTSFMSASIIAIIWTASSGSTGIIKVINKAYDYPIKRNYFFMRMKGIFFTLALMLSLQVIFASIVVGSQLIEFFYNLNTLSNLIYLMLNISRYLLPFLFLLILFLFTYKYLPYEKISFRHALPGAIFSTLGCISGSYLFSVYIGTRIAFYNNIYGNLSGVFVLILWIYTSSIIFLIGAEINAFIKKWRISRILLPWI